jgi:hypothetical protein
MFVVIMVTFILYVIQAHEQQERIFSTPYGRLSPVQQTLVKIKIDSVTSKIRLYYIGLCNATQGQYTLPELNDILNAGLHDIHHAQITMSSVPNEHTLELLYQKATETMKQALQILAVSHNGSGVLQDDVLTRGMGIPSGTLSHEVERNTEQQLHELREHELIGLEYDDVVPPLHKKH